MKSVAIAAELRDLITNAKSVPMSASCMVNRTETLELISRLEAAIEADTQQAASVTKSADAVVAEAKVQAEEIVADAKKEARQLVRETFVYTEAKERAARLVTEAEQESAELRQEADAYADVRIGELEVGLTKTLAQVKKMRTRLDERLQAYAERTQATQADEPASE